MLEVRSELARFGIGCIGALIPEILHWHRIARTGRWPKYARSFPYWLVSFLMTIIGGVVAVAVTPPGTSATQLLLLGTVWPQLMQSAAKARVLSRRDNEPHLGNDEHWLSVFLAT